jgi:hypothetical protein
MPHFVYYPASSGSGYHAASDAYFAEMTVQPNSTVKGHIDTFVRAIDTAGVFAKLDFLYLFFLHDEQASRVNLKSPGTYTATAVNSPTFTAFSGWLGDGATSYLNTNYTVVTNSVNFVLNDSALSVFIGSNVSTGAQIDAGNLNARIAARGTGTSVATRFGSPTTTTTTGVAAGSTSVGWTCVARNSSTGYDVVRNNDAPYFVTMTSTAFVTRPIFMLCVAGASNPTDYSTRLNRGVHISSYLSDTERDAYYDALSTLYTAIGV